jgi:DNA polymerase I
MTTTFQLLDCDYIMLENSPVVRLFGKTKEGKSVCAFYKDYFPYFYVLPKSKPELKEYLEKNFKDQIIAIEEVEKFLPVGYQKEKTKLIKITTKDPSKVSSIREALFSQKFVDNIFEADILFKYRFMNDLGLSGLKWVKVIGEPTSTKTVTSPINISANAIEETESEDTVPFKYMAFDIETISRKEEVPDPRKDGIIMISMAFSPNFRGMDSVVLVAKPTKHNKYVLSFNNEKEMLEKFVEIMDDFDPDFIVGYNVNNFDFPYIFERFRANRVSSVIGRCKQKQLSCNKFGMKYKTSVTGRVIVDVYDLIRESISRGEFKFKRLGLGDVAKEMLNQEKIAVAHSEISKFWNGTEDQLEKLIQYSKKDSELVLSLLLEKNMLEKHFELSKVSGILLQDCLDGGEATRLENLLLREFDKQDYVLPCKPRDIEVERRVVEREKKELKGALVLEPKTGLHADCVVYLDFRAMYPSIFISYNICPTTLLLSNENVEKIKTPYNSEFVSTSVKKGVIPKILISLMKDRERVRTEMKNAKTELEKRNLYAKQYALKVMANAFYGYTGYIRARLYTLDIANSITGCGRFLINKTRDVAETIPNCEVLYGDTDSVMVKTNTKELSQAFEIGKKVEESINKEMAGTVQMKIENVFKSLLILSKKRYAGLSYEKVNGEWTEEFVMKGIETVRRDWCDLSTKVLFEVLNILLKEQDTKKAVKYVKDTLQKIEKNQIPMEDLIITKSISKSISSYKGVQPHVELVKKMRKRSPATAPGIGDRVSYVIVKGLQLMSDRAEDPEYVKQHNISLDSKYYAESQILPPIERVFEVMGISKSELAGMGKQLSLATAFKNHTNSTDSNLVPVLNEIEGFVCNKCSKPYRRVPLIGKCVKCEGEILFSSNGSKSKYFQPL